MSFAARITVVLKEDPWKLIAEEVITVVELMGEYDVCTMVKSGCLYVNANTVLSVITCPETRTTTVFAVVFARTPELKDRSPLVILFASAVLKGIGMVELVVPVGHRTLRLAPPVLRYHV